MNYSALLANTILIVRYLKTVPAEYLKLLSKEERNSFVTGWARLCKQMESGLTEEFLFMINEIIYKYPALKKQFLGNLSIGEVREAAYNSNGAEDGSDNFRSLVYMCHEAFTLKDILAQINGEIDTSSQ